MKTARTVPGRGPDRRYWRRRANRRVRKARRLRSLLQLTVLLAANLLVFGVLGYAAVKGVRAVAASSRFDLRNVRVEGATRCSPEEVQARIRPALRRNVFDLDLGRISRLAEEDAWVRRATARRVLPDTLVVRIVERRPAAAAVIHGLAHLVDDRGVVIGATGSGLDDDLPVLTGLDELGGAELAAALLDGVRALERIRQADPRWFGELSELELGRSDRITARLRSSTTRVLLDPDRVTRNLGAFLALRSNIEGRVGPADHVDLRWSRRISVMPALTAENR